jgi:hypothetical protein
MTITRDDLIQPCRVCAGTGFIDEGAQDGQQGSFGLRRAGHQSGMSCEACNTTGEVLTETGKAVAEVVTLLQKQHRF